MTHMSLAKNLEGRVRVKEKFKGGGVKIFWKISLQICEYHKSSAKKVKTFFKNTTFQP